MTSAGLVRPLEVVVGATDGMMTEVSGTGMKEGRQVILGDEDKEEQEAKNQRNQGRRREDEQSVLADAAQGQPPAAADVTAKGSCVVLGVFGLRASERLAADAAKVAALQDHASSFWSRRRWN